MIVTLVPGAVSFSTQSQDEYNKPNIISAVVKEHTKCFEAKFFARF